ncbi:MAG TPA: hypothetical protein VJ755_14875 [Gemmatimonadales bacterium]|nr:hypothetical protein [Gemmatimonadales bacterium]
MFRKSGSVWVTPPGETSKLVETGFGHPDSAAYIAYLWNGASVGFRSDGWHRYTADLLGNRTRFVYSAVSPTRLDSIVDPAGHAFAFRYDSASAPGLVSDIWLRAPSGATSRAATFRFDASRRLTVGEDLDIAYQGRFDAVRLSRDRARCVRDFGDRSALDSSQADRDDVHVRSGVLHARDYRSSS